MTKPSDEMSDDGKALMRLMLGELKRRLEEHAEELKAADFEMIRKLLQDNAVTIASVQAGNFGEFAKAVAEEYPIDQFGERHFTQ